MSLTGIAGVVGWTAGYGEELADKVLMNPSLHQDVCVQTGS